MNRFHAARPVSKLGLFVLAAVLGRSVASAQQGSDDCASATPIGPVVYLSLQSTAAATPDGSSTCGSTAPDVWYVLAAQFDGLLDLSAFPWPTSSTLQPLISVHSGCPGTAANELACNGAGAGAHVAVHVERGSSYWIRVSGTNGTTGGFNLVVDGPVTAMPVNDDPAEAADIGPGSYASDTYEADSDWSTPCDYQPTYGLRIVWFRYVPGVSGPVTVDTCWASTDDTVLAVYDGCSLVAFNDDYCGIGKNWLSWLTWNASAGVEYLIAAREYFANYEIAFPLHLAGPPNVNDACASAPPIGVGTRAVLLPATAAEGSPSCAVPGESDVFYTFTAITGGRLAVSTCGTSDYDGVDSGADTSLSIHGGCPASSANELACNDTSAACSGDAGVLEDASVSMQLAAGQSVVVRLAGRGPNGLELPVLLTVDFEPGIGFCAGDGTAAACPCGNSGSAGHGCASSAEARGALLGASGEPVLSSDSLALHTEGAPPSAIALYVQGTLQAAAGAGAPFGDGLRCVAGAVVRLGLRTSVNGASSFGAGDGTGTLVSIAGAIPPAGATRHYQAWYRDAQQSFCTTATFNLSNGLTLAWSP